MKLFAGILGIIISSSMFQAQAADKIYIQLSSQEADPSIHTKYARVQELKTLILNGKKSEITVTKSMSFTPILGRQAPTAEEKKAIYSAFVVDKSFNPETDDLPKAWVDMVNEECASDLVWTAYLDGDGNALPLSTADLDNLVPVRESRTSMITLVFTYTVENWHTTKTKYVRRKFSCQ